MIYLVHTAHRQFLALIVGSVAWILITTTVGLNEWRLWHVANVSVITSGLAWVGIWRTCFYSHALPEMENCQSISISDEFAPVEIPVAQVLMLLGVVCGVAANISGAAAMRLAYFSVMDHRNIRLVFVMAGTLYLLTGVSCLVPLVWNMKSVLENNTIDFPPEFHLPAAPVRQQVGSAIVVGMFASILMLISGLLFLSYHYVWKALNLEDPKDTKDPLHGPWTETTLAQKSDLPKGDDHGRDNPTFRSEEA